VFTVLMPSANDDYSLSLSIPAIAPFVDEVVVYVDAAEDRTMPVLDHLLCQHPNVTAIVGNDGVGWCEARNRLMRETAAQHLLFIDADDIFCEWQVDQLRKLPGIANRSRSGFVMLGLMEAVGDFHHGTGRGWVHPHYDKCHAYVNRAVCTDLEWRMKDTYTYPFASGKRAASGQVLFLHAKGVKSDVRLIERHTIRSQMKSGRRLVYGAVPTPEEAHREAMRILLTDKHNPIRRKPERVRMPSILSHRFQMVEDNGVLVDRIDHGFQLKGSETSCASVPSAQPTNDPVS